VRGAIRALIKIVRREFETDAGRANAIGMLGGLVALLAISPTPLLEFILKLFRPEARLELPIAQLFVAFLVYDLICVVFVALRRN
jgi:hypothetical protein